MSRQQAQAAGLPGATGDSPPTLGEPEPDAPWSASSGN